jgi:hypothetical protein
VLGHPRCVRGWIVTAQQSCNGPERGQYTALGYKRGTTEQWDYDKLMTALRETLSADEIAQLAADGAAWSEDQAVEEALP